MPPPPPDSTVTELRFVNPTLVLVTTSHPLVFPPPLGATIRFQFLFGAIWKAVGTITGPINGSFTIRTVFPDFRPDRLRFISPGQPWPSMTGGFLRTFDAPIPFP